MSSDHTNLSFRPINWSVFMKPFLTPEVMAPIEQCLQGIQAQNLHSHGLLIILRSFTRPDAVKEVKYLEDLLHQQVYDPLICIYLAEHYQNLANDFDDVWFYQLLSLLFLPTYLQTTTYTIESLQKLKNIADNTLENSIELLERKLPISLVHLQEILILFVKFQLQTDLLLKYQDFMALKNQLIDTLVNFDDDFTLLLAFEVLFGVSLQYKYDSLIISKLKTSLHAQKVYINKKKIELEFVYSKLQKDHDYYVGFREQILQFFYLRVLCWQDPTPTKQQRVIQNEINIMLMKILRLMLESSKGFLPTAEVNTIVVCLSHVVSYLYRQDPGRQSKTAKNLQFFTVVQEEVDLRYSLRKLQLQLKMGINEETQRQDLSHMQKAVDGIDQRGYLQRLMKYFYLCRMMKFYARFYDSQDKIITSDKFISASVFNDNDFDRSFMFNKSQVLSPINHVKHQTTSLISLSFLHHLHLFSRIVGETYDAYAREFEESNTFVYLVCWMKVQKHTEELMFSRGDLNQFSSINSIKQPEGAHSLKMEGVQRSIKQVSLDSIRVDKILSKAETTSTSAGVVLMDGTNYHCIVKQVYRENTNEATGTYQNWEGALGVVPILAMSKNFSELTLLQPIMRKNLTSYQKEGRLSILSILHLFNQILDTLIGLHQRGLVHGNLKPNNVFMDGASVYVSDFMIYRLPERDDHMDAVDLGTMVMAMLVDYKPQQVVELRSIVEKMKKSHKLTDISRLIQSYIQ